MSRVTVLFRHCESEFNVDRNSTIRDCSLTEKGIEQAKKLEGTFDLIICSPLRRCRQTFELSNLKLKKNRSASNELEEEEGIKGKNMIIYSELFREHKIKPCDFFKRENIDEKEKEDEVIERVGKAKEKIKELFKKNSQYKTIAIVTHADFVFYFTSYILDDERFGTWLGNGESVKYDVFRNEKLF